MNLGEHIIESIMQQRNELLSRDLADDGNPIVIPREGNNFPLVSIEVLAYNHGWSLTRCIESIMRQKTNFFYEIIIGNDCSKDDTQIVAEQLQKKYSKNITLVTSTHNIGLNRNARNVRNLMKGAYVAFCEADDWWNDEHKLQTQVDQMLENKKISLLHGLVKFFYEKDGQSRNLKNRFPNKKPTFEWIFDETYRIETASVMCRRADLMDLYSTMPTLLGPMFLMQDTQLFCLLAKKGQVKCESKVVSVRSISGRSLSINNDLVSTLKYHDNAFHMKLALCDYFNVSALARMRSVNYYISSCIEILANHMSRKQAIKIATQLYPEYKTRIKCMGIIKRPKNLVLRKLYTKFLFPCTKFRTAFL